MKKTKAGYRKIVPTLVVAVLLGAVAWYAWPSSSPSSAGPATSVSSPADHSVPPFNKAQYPTDVASSLWVVVNKGRALPSTYVPAGLTVPNIPLRLPASSPEMHVRPETAAALERMAAAAKSQGINLMLASGYRSYSEQQTVYQGYVNSQGQTAADTFSARPGHSEHQTGLAADLEPTSRQCEVDQCFENTPEGQWLAANADSYGFIIRYQKNAQSLTGYEYEPWHVRYVGQALAAELSRSPQTLEQFFNLPAYTSYPAEPFQLKSS